jgi:hypothetical protein
MGEEYQFVQNNPFKVKGRSTVAPEIETLMIEARGSSTLLAVEIE